MKRWIAGLVAVLFAFLVYGTITLFPWANHGLAFVIGSMLSIFLYSYLVHGETPDV
jgi:hypothetical protein